jgi:hypothetical protein
VNRSVAEVIWKQGTGYASNCGVTTFHDHSGSADELVVSILRTIEEHHPDWNRLEVHGALFNHDLETELARLGFGNAIDLDGGLIVSRRQDRSM